jgi:hypothetical protein
MILYHGTTHDIKEIDVTRGKPFKDFGRGFYATAVYEHARNLKKDAQVQFLSRRDYTGSPEHFGTRLQSGET